MQPLENGEVDHAEFANQKVMPVTKKWKALYRIRNPDIRTNRFVRDGKTLLSPEPNRPLIIRGGKVKFNEPWDPFNQILTDAQKYKPPKKPLPPLPEVEDPLNWHKMLGKYQFTIVGSFDSNGATFRDSFAKLCNKLHIVGWVKCRGGYATGHLQGDALALSYVKKWLKDHHAPGANIAQISYANENYGLRELEYKYLVQWQYLQSFAGQRQTAKSKQKAEVIKRALEVSRMERDEKEKFFEEHSVRNY